MFRNKLISFLIKWLEKDLNSNVLETKLTDEQSIGLLATLWDNDSFRNYVADRNAKLIHAIAGIAGNEPEPRDKTRLWMGQRVEILLLASRAKACREKLNRERAEKKQTTEEAKK